MKFLGLLEKLRALLAPDAPPKVEEIRFKAKIAGKKREFLVVPRLDEEKGYWRAFVVGTWCQNPYVASFTGGFSDSPSLQGADWPRLMQRAHLVRRIPLDSTRSLIVFPDAAELKEGRKSIPCDLSSLGYANGFFELPDAELVAEARKLCAQPSPFAEAYQWFFWTEEERVREMCRMERSDFEHLRRIHEHLGVLLCHLVPQLVEEEYSWNWRDDWKPFGDFYPGSCISKAQGEARFKVLKQWLGLWHITSKQFFEPKYLWNFAVPSEISQFSPDTEALFLIEFTSIPTAHELLETQVFLSSWANQNAPELAEKLLDFPA